MILKQLLRGAFGFGLPIALPGFMIDGANGDDRMLLMLCAPPLAGILGALSLRLKKRGVIVIGLAFLGLGLALLAFEPTRYDFVDGYPYFLILFIFGGGSYGAFIGWRRWKEGIRGRPLPD